jgi:hypothetical protein
VCGHAAVDAIDADSRPQRAVAKKYGLAPSALQRHRTHRASETAAAARRAKRPATAITPTADMDPIKVVLETLDSLRLTLVNADEGDKPRIASAITSAAKQLRALMGEQELTWPIITRSPLWAAFESRLETALRPYPDAARAVVEALRVAA